MIIPLSREEIKIGDIVINIKDINEQYYIIPIGHEFEVLSYDNSYGKYEVKSIDVDFIINVRKDFFTKKIDLKSANKEYILRCETTEYKDFIIKYCPNKTYGYEDREQYEACSLKKYRCDECVPNLDCAKHLSKEDISKSKVLLKHLRRNKLIKINKNI